MIETILSYFRNMWNKAWKLWDDTSFPQMGEEGCGSRNPTRLLLICYNAWNFGVLCDPESVFKATCRMGIKKGGKGMFFAAYFFDFLPTFPLNLS